MRDLIWPNAIETPHAHYSLLDIFVYISAGGLSENGSNWPRTVHVPISLESIPTKWNLIPRFYGPFLLWATVVVGTPKNENLTSTFTHYDKKKKKCTKVRTAGAARLFFLIQTIISLTYELCVAAQIARKLATVTWKVISAWFWLIRFALMIDSSVVIHSQYMCRKDMNICIRKPGDQQGTPRFIASPVQQRKRSLRDTETKELFVRSSTNYASFRKSLASCSVWYPDPSLHTLATYRNRARKK